MIINEGTLRYFFAVAFTYDSSEIIDSFKWNDSVPVSHKWNHNLISIYKILQNILALFKHPNKGPYKYPIYRSTSWQSHFKGPFKYDFHRWKMTNAWVQKHKTKFVENYSKRKIVEMRFSVIITLRKAAFVSRKTPHDKPQFRAPQNSRTNSDIFELLV